jgi:hypothetical protein
LKQRSSLTFCGRRSQVGYFAVSDKKLARFCRYKQHFTDISKILQ